MLGMPAEVRMHQRQDRQDAAEALGTGTRRQGHGRIRHPGRASRQAATQVADGGKLRPRGEPLRQGSGRQSFRFRISRKRSGGSSRSPPKPQAYIGEVSPVRFHPMLGLGIIRFKVVKPYLGNSPLSTDPILFLPLN